MRHGVLEHLAALHAQMADRAGRRRPAVDVELVLVAAVGAEVRGQHAAVAARRRCPRLQHHRAGAVAEQHAGRAVGPVEDAREGLRADDQRALGLAGADQRVGGGRARRRSRSRPPAGRRRRRASCPSFSWTVTAVAGKVLSGVEVATHDQVDVGGRRGRRRRARAARPRPPRSEVISPSAAIWRSRMPVRCAIHSSEVSTIFARSSLVRTFRGR